MDNREAKRFVANIAADLVDNISEGFVEIYIKRYEKENETKLSQLDRQRLSSAMKSLHNELKKKSLGNKPRGVEDE